MVGGQLVAARGGAAIVLQAAEHALDGVANAVEDGAEAVFQMRGPSGNPVNGFGS